MKKIYLRYWTLAISMMLVSFNANAFPIVLASGIGYMIPTVMIIMGAGGAATGKINSKAILFMIFICAVLLSGFLSFGSSEEVYSKQSFPMIVTNKSSGNSYVSSYKKTSELVKSGDIKVIKLQELRNLHASSDVIFGYDDIESALNYIESNDVSKAIVISSDAASGERFIDKVTSMTDIKMILASHFESPYYCIETCQSVEDEPRKLMFEDVELTRRSSVLKEYNLVYLSDNMNSFGIIHSEGLRYLDSELYYILGESYYMDQLKDLDENKETIVVVSSSFNNNPKNLIAKKEIIAKVSATSKKATYEMISDNFREVSERSDDTSLTEFYPHEMTYVSEDSIYYRFNKDKDYYKVLCFSDDCRFTFGLSNTVNITDKNIVGFDGGFKINEEALAKLDGISKDRILISPEDSISVVVGKMLGKKLSDQGYDFRGFTNHHSTYFSDVLIKTNGDTIHIKKDSYLYRMGVIVSDFIDFDELDKKYEVSVVSIALLFLVLGFWSSSKITMVRTTSLIFTMLLSVLMLDTLYLPREQQNYGTTSAALPILGLMVLAIIKSKNLIQPCIMAVICAALVYFNQLNATSIVIIICYSAGAIITPLVNLMISIQLGKPSVVGGKYKITKRYVDEQYSGYIVSNAKELKSVISSGNYLLRSNHLTASELALSGCFDTFEVTKENAVDTIEAEIDKLSKVMPKESIQFWLMPKINVAEKGVATSFGQNTGEIQIAIGKGDSVTEGENSTLYNLPRNVKPKEKVLRNIMAKIKEIEIAEQRPVVIEFGISKLSSKVIIFQVKYQDTDYPQYISSQIINGQYSVSQYEPFTHLGSEIVAKLSSNQVIAGGHTMMVMKSSQLVPANDYDLSDSNLSQLVSDIMEVDVSKEPNLSSAIEMLKPACQPVFDLYIRQGRKLGKIPKNGLPETMKIIDFHMGVYGGIYSQDICSEVFRGVEGKLLDAPSVISYKDIVHQMICIAIMKLRVFADRKHPVQNSGGSSVREFDGGVHLMDALEDATEDVVIVRGDFEGDQVTLDSFVTLTDKQKSESVIVAETVPVALIGQVSKAKAIILRKGTPLSHIAMTAKKLKLPCKIEKT